MRAVFCSPHVRCDNGPVADRSSRNLPRGIVEQGIPTGETSRQQVGRSLRDQRPGDAFELRQVRHHETLAECGLGGRGEAVQQARVHGQPPCAHDAITDRGGFRTSIPGGGA